MDKSPQLIVSSSPHVRSGDDIPSIIWSVVLALTPAVAVSLCFFGLDALRVYVLCIAAAVATEALCLKMRGKPLAYALDGSAFVTGLLLAMVLPPNAASYAAVVGGAFAIAIAKHCFGGLGNNIWNPALAARIFLQFAYPREVSMARWVVPSRLLWAPSSEGWTTAYQQAARTVGAHGADVVTMATPLAKEGAVAPLGHLDLLFGNAVAGCIGETCKIALIIGGIYLIVRNIVDWRVPLLYIATVFILTWLLPAGKNAQVWDRDPFYHVLSGGLILGAFFMATDMVTTPVTPRGRAIFAVGCGIMVALIRRWGGYPEGVCYSIIFMNTFTPLIDRWVRPRIYGSRTPRPGEKAA